VVANALPDKTGHKPRNIDEIGFGKGANAAVDIWRGLLARLAELRARRGMHIILLGHAVIKSFKNPEGEDYDRYELKLSKVEAGLLKEWCDAVLFAKHELFTVPSGANKKKVRGISDGARYMFTQWCPAYDAGNRYNLPDRMPLDWAEFWTAKTTGLGSPEGIIEAEILSLVGENADLLARAQRGLEACAGNPAKLSRLLNKVRAAVQGE
jgi:hypothetical protein